MSLHPNRLKIALQKGDLSMVAFVFYPTPALIELVASCGYTGVIMDMEHGLWDLKEIENGVRAAESFGITPLVRLPTIDPDVIGKLLDMGVKGIVFARISTAEQARAAVATTRYAPRGNRGACPNVRAVGYDSLDWDTYCQSADAETLVICLIEDQEGAENIDAILEVDGIDVIFTGPFDMSVSLGLGGKMDHPRVREVLTRVAEKAIDKGVAVAALAVLSMPAEMQHWVDRGVRLFMISLTKTVSLALHGARSQLTAMLPDGTK